MSFKSTEPSLDGVPGKSIKLTDPETMRALAHPARITLWQHLLLEGPATATECAPIAELSPSACSYHLRQLARFGFVQQDQGAAANGRERPWRAVVTSTTVEDLEDPVALMAARLLDYTLEERWQVARQRYESNKQDYPAQWRRAAGGDRTVLYATADEVAELREQIRRLYAPLIRLSGQDRPEGARPMQGAIDFVPLFGPTDLAAPPDGSGAADAPDATDAPAAPRASDATDAPAATDGSAAGDGAGR